MMCSATLIPRIRDLVIRFAPNHNVIDLNKAMEAASDVKQFFFAVGPARKKALLEYLLRRRTALKVYNVSARGTAIALPNPRCRNNKPLSFVVQSSVWTVWWQD
jgi:superfamily II DNA/RNA helicase